MNAHEFEETLKQVARNYVIAEAAIEAIVLTPDGSRRVREVTKNCMATVHSQKQWVMTILRDNFPDKYHDFCMEIHQLWMAQGTPDEEQPVD